MVHVANEIASQPACWREAAQRVSEARPLLPADGERVAVIGCGTSWHVAQAYASLRERAGKGETDAFAASEKPGGRRYDRILGLTRSGTTTEVIHLLEELGGKQPTTAITADASSPVAKVADDVVVLDFADERAVVQTRFATTTHALLRLHLDDGDGFLAEAQLAVTSPLPQEALSAEQVTFLGTGWTYGLAQEAALKLRETAGAWAEAYPAMEYRHGPISIAGPGRCTWFLSEPPAGLVDDVRNTGGAVILAGLDPLAELVRAQRVAVAMAQQRGLDPDHPRHLTRSVILDTR